MKTNILILSIAAALPASWALAQNDAPPAPPRDGERPQKGPRDGERPRGDGPRDGQGPRGPMPMPFLQVLDTDDDGIISEDEIKNAPDSLKKLDKNGDGQLTRDEWQPTAGRPPQREGDRQPAERPARGEGERPPGDRPQGPGLPLVEALDADHDGTISVDEIANSSEALAKLDKNSDGQLGPREYGPRRPAGPPPRDGDKPDDKAEK